MKSFFIYIVKSCKCISCFSIHNQEATLSKVRGLHKLDKLGKATN